MFLWPGSCLALLPGSSEILRLCFCPHAPAILFAGADSSRAHTTSVSIIFSQPLHWKIKVTFYKMSEVSFLAVFTSWWGCFSLVFQLNFVFTPQFLINPSVWLRLRSQLRLMCCFVDKSFCFILNFKKIKKHKAKNPSFGLLPSHACFYALNERYTHEWSANKPRQPYHHTPLVLTESLKQIIQSSPAVLLCAYELVSVC